MSISYSVSAIKAAGGQIAAAMDDVKKRLDKANREYSKLRSMQIKEISYCDAQLKTVAKNKHDVANAKKYNEDKKHAVERKIAQLREELRRIEKQKADAKASCASLSKELSSMSPPSSTGDSEQDAERQRAYNRQRAAISSELSAKRAEIETLERNSAAIKKVISRLEAIIHRVNENQPKLDAILADISAKQHLIEKHRFDLKETKGKLYSVHDSLNGSYYNGARVRLEDAMEKCNAALVSAESAAHKLHSFGESIADDVEVSDLGEFSSIVHEMKNTLDRMAEHTWLLSNANSRFGDCLRDNISAKTTAIVKDVKRSMEKVAEDINQMRETLDSAIYDLKRYSSVAG